MDESKLPLDKVATNSVTCDVETSKKRAESLMTLSARHKIVVTLCKGADPDMRRAVQRARDYSLDERVSDEETIYRGNCPEGQWIIRSVEEDFLVEMVRDQLGLLPDHDMVMLMKAWHLGHDRGRM